MARARGVPPVVQAQFDHPACARCGLPVRRGQYVEKVRVFDGAPPRWVHLGCEPQARGSRDRYGDEDGYGRKGGHAEPEPTESLGDHNDEPTGRLAEAPPPTSQTKGQEIPPAAPPAAQQNGAATEAYIRGFVKSAVEKAVEKAVAEASTGMQKRVEEKLTTSVKETLREPITQMINQAVDSAVARVTKLLAPREIHVKRHDGLELKLEGQVLHYAVPAVLEHLEDGEDVFLPGPTGSGKTHLVKQVAQILGARFGMISCSKGMSEGQLNGRLIPRGEMGQFEYLGTILVQVYEEGGVFLFDEMDGADANVLLAINSAIANGVMAVPNRYRLPEGVTLEQFLQELEAYDFTKATEPFKYRGYGPFAARHPQFRAVAAANTYGTGGDRKYVGRDPLDLSTRDRFLVGTVEVDYDPKVEAFLCPYEDILRACWAWRKKIIQGEMERAMSTRTIAKLARKRALRGWTIEQMAQAFFMGWSQDEVMQVYGKALKQDRPANDWS